MSTQQLETPTATISANDPVQNTDHENSLTRSHLATYPLVSAAAGFTGSLPVFKKVSDNLLVLKAKQAVEPLEKRAAPTIKKADELCHSALKTLDKSVPQLQTITPQAVTEAVRVPVDQVKGTVTSYTEIAEQKLNVVTIPVKNAINNIKNKADQIYSTHAKPVINKSIDPILLPVNIKIEALVEQYCPTGEPIVPESYSTELGHAYQITGSAIKRAFSKKSKSGIENPDAISQTESPVQAGK